MTARVLVVTAVEPERAAITAAMPPHAPVSVIVGGVGPAASAAAAGLHLARGFDLVLSAGIGGGFAPLQPGDLAVASSICFADLGAETAAGFVALAQLGYGTDRYDVDASVAARLAEHSGGRLGTVLTVATVTGSAVTADALRARFPDAVAEGMEGAGVAAAAHAHGVAFGELRAISNPVGPRDRAAWKIPAALSALGAAVAAVLDAEVLQ